MKEIHLWNDVGIVSVVQGLFYENFASGTKHEIGPMLIQIANRYAEAEHHYMKCCMPTHPFHCQEEGNGGLGACPQEKL